MANEAQQVSRLPIISIPPLQSTSIKANQHHNSSTSLLPTLPVNAHDCAGATEPPQPAFAIAKPISNLQGLLHEAARIARQVAEDEKKQNAIIEPAPSSQRRPSKGIQSRASVFIEHLDKDQTPPIGRGKFQPRVSFSEPLKNSNQGQSQRCTNAEDALQACGAAHEEPSKLKAALVLPTLTVTDEDWELQPISESHQRPPSLSENLEPVEIKPVGLPHETIEGHLWQRRINSGGLPSRREVKKHIRAHQAPPIAPRVTSKIPAVVFRDFVGEPERSDPGETLSELKHEDGSAVNEGGRVKYLHPHRPGHEGHFSQIFGVASKQTSIDLGHIVHPVARKINLGGCRHVDIQEAAESIDLHESCNHQPIARDWPNSRKRFAAAVACINTACLGIIIGIYAGEVPAIQYVIVDFHHYTILGNVFLYLGLVIPTLFLWPLPLLHGRKPYTVGALCIALCLQVPQGIAVGTFRSPYVRTYRVVLLLSRAVSGFALGFANINLQSTLLDLFGASLQSGNPHGGILDENDARRHGGGMGVWLGIWSWCTIGSISLGFLIGTLIISTTNVTWGFWACLLLLMFVLLLNMIAPELRRSAFRRTIAEMQGDEGNFSRIAQGEVKMHLKAAGPLWWGEEVKAGMEMCWLMLKQPGFVVVAVYTAWVYAQFTMILMLLGALASRYYTLLPQYVGLCTVSLGGGALLATPFQKASLLSRARYHPPRTDSMTFRTSYIWSSHFVRRTIVTGMLPLAALAYTLTSRGPPMKIVVPCIFAAIVGFLSNLVIAECYGLIMVTFDTSDLQPGMTGRPARKSVVERFRGQRTNFSCYPRVSAGFAIIQSLKFIFGAVTTGVCGRVERRFGTLKATAIVAATLLGLTILLTLVLLRFKPVKMIPTVKNPGDNLTRQETTWEPVTLGKPSGTKRNISILEAGKQSRWSEIRKRNRLDQGRD